MYIVPYNIIQSCFSLDFHVKHGRTVLHARKVSHDQLNFFKLQMDVSTTSERQSYIRDGDKKLPK